MTLALPADATDPSYAPAILAAVSAGNYTHAWAPVTSSAGGHTGTFMMSQDALMIDGVRWGMGAGLMQQVADILGALLPPVKLRCLQWEQATLKMDPVTVGMLGLPLSALTRTDTMRSYSAAIDKKLAAAGGIPKNTCAPSGKPWVISNELLAATGRGANFGWFVNTTASSWLGVQLYPADNQFLGLRVIQTIGTAHGLDQADYSETAIFVHRNCIVDGQQRDIADVYGDPELSALVSSEGPLRLVRQPGVPIVACATPAAGGPVVTAAATPGGVCKPPAGGPGGSGSSSGTSVWPWVAAAGAAALAGAAWYEWRQWHGRRY